MGARLVWVWKVYPVRLWIWSFDNKCRWGNVWSYAKLPIMVSFIVNQEVLFTAQFLLPNVKIPWTRGSCWRPSGIIWEEPHLFFLGTSSCLVDVKQIFGKAWETRFQCKVFWRYSSGLAVNNLFPNTNPLFQRAKDGKLRKTSLVKTMKLHPF